MDDDQIIDRLRALGREPVDSAVASQHLTAIGAVAVRPQRRFGRAAVAAAAVVGFVFGSLGLGWAGALPGPVQDVADDVLSTVGVGGPWKNRGQCVSEAAKANPDDEVARKAAKDACPKGGKGKGKGVGAGAAGGNGVGNGVGKDKAAKSSDPCKGPPPWAGRPGSVSEADKAAFEQQRAACPPEADDADDEVKAEAELDETPTTTAAPTTTTTTAPPTTTTTAAPTTTTAVATTATTSAAADDTTTTAATVVP